ncbi:MAG: DUF1566 domain-containing protein [Verrucomicrobiota bacterium JB025]|nr:sulfatase-like hydrolase/transferase [Verrucomicrobiota bacterium JB025]
MFDSLVFRCVTLVGLSVVAGLGEEKVGYPVVDTGQERCYDTRGEIVFPMAGEDFYGQDAQFSAGKPAYRDHGDGTVSDLVTGLMWTKAPGKKVTWAEAVANAAKCRTGGYDDWRLPSVKELYSLIQFDGLDPDPMATGTAGLKPFIDTSVFDFSYGDPAAGERVIDSQFATTTIYTATTMGGNKTMFGVNFADGRIKGYPAESAGRRQKTYGVFYVRGNPAYGKNRFEDGGDGTVTDHATGLVWMKADSGTGMDWKAALEFAEQLELGGHDDWRLPNAKELQSIVDYTRSPDATGSAAIDPVFAATAIRNEEGKKDFGQYWTSTTHLGQRGAGAAVYVAFGRASGFMGPRGGGEKRLLDVHGAGSQRSDPKAGDASRFPQGRGPQGDVIRIDNLVRCVRGGGVKVVAEGPPVEEPAARGVAERGGRERGGPGPGAAMGEGMARSGPQAAGGGRFLQRFDRNGDGKVTKDEFDGPERRFRMVDKDGDGVVTKEESDNAPLPPGRGGSGAQPGPGAERAPVGPQPGRVVKQVAKKVERKAADAVGSGKPNIIVILADDMGWTGTSVAMVAGDAGTCSDFYQTPRIAGLANEGVRFSRAYSPAALCSPARAAILTGKSPAAVGITTPGRGGRAQVSQKLTGASQLREFPAAEETIAEVLGEAGYATAHFGKWHLPGSDPGAHGFDAHDGATGNGGPGEYADPNPKDVFGITRRGIAFMEEQSAAGRPFYLQLSHFAVHTPTLARKASVERFEKLPGGTRHQDAGFAGMTFDLDEGVGMVLDRVDELGLAGNTYVVFLSDNGAPGGRRKATENLPLRGGKGTFFEGGIRVPMIVRGPGVAAGGVCGEPVIGCDLLPTFCGWAGVAVPTGIDGVDLAALVSGKSAGFRRSGPAFLFHYPHYGQGPLQTPESAIVAGDYKLIRKHEDGAVMVFDLAKDPGEKHDLSKTNPELVQRLEKLLAERLEESGARMPTANPDYDPSRTPVRRRGAGRS